MKCDYCPRDLGLGTGTDVVVLQIGANTEAKLFCDKDCLYGWVFMTAVDDAMKRGTTTPTPVSAEELRRRARRLIERADLTDDDEQPEETFAEYLAAKREEQPPC